MVVVREYWDEATRKSYFLYETLRGIPTCPLFERVLDHTRIPRRDYALMQRIAFNQIPARLTCV